MDKESCANIGKQPEHSSFSPAALWLIDRHQGIHVVHSPRPEVTHNIVQEFTLTPFCVLSLLHSKVATPKWLTEVIRQGAGGNNCSSTLEQYFELPDISSYLPPVSTTLPSTLSSTEFWTNSASRGGILSNYRFIIFTRDSENLEDLQSIISLTGGGYELLSVGSGKARLHRRLSANRQGIRMVIVIDNDVKASVAPDVWNELIDEAKTYDHLTLSYSLC